MNTNRSGFALIPQVARMLALLIAGGIVALVNWREPAPEMPMWSWYLINAGLFLVVGGAILLYGYIYADAQRRAMRAILWLLLAIFIPNAVGIILYFVLRYPLPEACPECGIPLKAGFTYCPGCGKAMKPACGQCGQPLETDWANCPHCGTRLRA